MKTVKIEYLGKTPRTFPLPIPFVSYSEKTGEVTCDPIGEFPIEDGERLLEIAPEVFRRVEAEPDGAGQQADGCTVSAPEAHLLVPPRYRGKQNAINWRNRNMPEGIVTRAKDGLYEIVPPDEETPESHPAEERRLSEEQNGSGRED